MKDIAITGMGLISAIGIGRHEFWENCKKAESGIKRIHAFDTHGLRSNIAAYVDAFTPKQFLPPGVYRRMSRVSQMAVAASVEALADSRLDLSTTNTDRIGVIVGTAYGSSSSVEDFYLSLLRDGPRGAQPLYFPETVPNAPASHMAMFHGITGPNTTFCQNEISAENAILYARNLLLQDQADVILVGGADELSKILFECYHVFLNPAITKEDEPPAPIPGAGLVLGEGAGVLVMERMDFARKRGAPVYGVLKSASITGGSAAVGHYETSGEQMARAMESAVEQAGLSPEGVDQVHVSANFSSELDRMEYHQLQRFFTGRKKEFRVTPLKYLIGDFGGAGILRAAAVLLSLHYRHPLPEIKAEALLGEPEQGIQWQFSNQPAPNVCLMTSSTFGGGSASLVFGKN